MDPQVWFVAEVDEGGIAPVTLGLAAEARRVAQALGGGTAALLMGKDVSGLAASLPADRVYLVQHPALDTPYASDAHCALAAHLLGEQAPAALLLAATPFGSELAARLAARLGAGLASGCLRLDAGEGSTLLMVRPAYGGRASCTVSCPTARPQIATLLPDSLAARGPRTCPPPEVVPIEAGPGELPSRKTCLGLLRPDPDSLDITEADVLVAGGRGVGGAEAFAHLRELAAWLGGSVAASRPAVDAGWAPYGRQVGSSGKFVAPRLYIACGISGASQHVVGMRDAATVVAVNQDPYAPMVKMADLALIGDLREIIPAAVERLRATAEPPADQEPAPSPAEAAAAPRQEPLRIAVCLSLCLDPERPLDLRRGGQEALRGPRLLNPADAHALEEALRLKDALPGSRVTALTLGPPEAEGVLRQALALGADEAVHLWDEGFAGSDSLASARILAAAIRRLEPEVVLCGAANPDGATGQLPLQLGELLGLPSLTRVVALSLDSEGARVHCRWQRGQRIAYRAALPALFAVEVGINRPRYAPLRRRLQAAQRPVLRWGLGELGLPASQVGEAGSPLRVLTVGPPKPISRGLFVPDESLSAEERWQQLLGGGLGGPPGQQQQQEESVLRGPPDYLAEQLVRFLLERGFVRERGCPQAG